MARIAQLLAGGRTSSCEFFPPKNEAGWLSLGRAIAELEPLRPDFVSVTYGAGGSTRTKTADLVSWVRRQTPIAPMAHLTCQGHTREEVRAMLTDYQAEGVENILALGGDPPAHGDAQPEGDYRFSADLVTDVRSFGGFSVGVAAHPELHPRSPDKGSDRQHLAAKLEAADFAITQFFFEARHYFDLVDSLALRGVRKPVIAGIMPATSIASIARMSELQGSEFPTWLSDKLYAAEDQGPGAVRAVGVDEATKLCQELMAAGVPGFQFFTLNFAAASREICNNLGI